jgi:hypothetical protein
MLGEEFKNYEAHHYVILRPPITACLLGQIIMSIVLNVHKVNLYKRILETLAEKETMSCRDINWALWGKRPKRADNREAAW